MVLVRIKGIKPVTVRKGGRIYRYYYHRATNTRIEAEPGTAAFAAEVERLDRKVSETEPRDCSLHALIVDYRKSPEFGALAVRTKTDYQKVFDYLAPIGDMPLLELDQPFIYALRDKAFRQRKRRFANYVVAVISLLMTWGIARGKLKVHTAADVEKIRRPKGMRKANRAWEDSEREVVLKRAPIELRVMVALGMFAALREGDACAIGKTSYDGKLIEAIASKNGEPLWIPAHFRLREILEQGFAARKDRLQRRKVVPIDPPTLAVSSRGKSWTESGFRASFFKLIRMLEREGLVRPGLTFHGLRHTNGKLIIEAGGNARDVAKLLGDRSDAMGELYSQEHEKKQRLTATMRKLERIERGKMLKYSKRFQQ